MRPAEALQAAAKGLGRGAAALAQQPAALFRKRHPPAGARPGTLVVDDSAPPSRLRLTLYSAESAEERELADAGALAAVLGGPRKLWLDVVGLGSESVLRELGRLLAIHPLALEDIVNVPQRPKIEAYPQQLLILVRRLAATTRGSVETEQLSVLLGRGWVATFRERDGDVFDPVRRRLQEGRGPIRVADVDYLAYALADTVVDGYYPLLEGLGDQVDGLEEQLLEVEGPWLLERLAEIKRSLLQLRRAVWPLRDALRACLATPPELLSTETRVYLRDTLDHCAQASEVVESYRELASELLGAHLSLVGHRTNEIMRVLTVMASIFIPLTFMAGVYGMNFENMPELRVWWTYPALLLAMLSVAALMLLYFRRRGWLGRRRRDSGRPGGGP
jgi:magnesium transporter